MLTFTLVADDSNLGRIDILSDACEYFIHSGMKLRLSNLSFMERSFKNSFDSSDVIFYQDNWIDSYRVADGVHTICRQGLKRKELLALESLSTSLLPHVDCDKDKLSIIIMKLLGHKMNDRVSFILCAYENYTVTPSGETLAVHGDSSQQVVVAQKLGIKIVNICYPPDLKWLHNRLLEQEVQ